MSSQGKLRSDLLAAAGETRVDLDHEITPLFISLDEGILFDLLTEMNAANGTRHFVKPNADRDAWYAYTTRNRQYKLNAASDASLSAAAEHVTAIDGWRVSADTVINQQKATVDEPTFPLGYIQVWEYQNLPPLPLTIRSAAPLKVRVDFADYVLSCPDVVTVSSGDPLTVSYLHHGYNGDVTLTSSGTTVLKAFKILGREAVRQPELTHTADDVTSETLPRGIRAGPQISGDFVGALASAIGISEHVVWRYGAITKRPAVKVENWLPTQLVLDLYDVIAFTSTQLRVSALRFEIVGINEQANRAADTGAVHWVTTYQLAEQKVAPTFFVLDSSLLNGADVLAW